MSGPNNPTTAVSAPGKVLLTGGYLVLDRAYAGLVFSLDARINVVAQEITTSPGVQLSEIVVESPQFHQAQWRYGYHLADEDGGIKVTQLQVGSVISPNPFVETTLSFALTYISRVTHQRPTHTTKPARLTILADNDYYSQPPSSSSSSSTTGTTTTTPSAPATARFARFPSTLSAANKTGLGSSAALVTSLTAALLTHYLPPQLFDLASSPGRAALHNLAQAAHCAAQGKVGSGFDVAAAVHGSCRYRRFSPSILSSLPEPGAPGFGAALQGVVESLSSWDAECDTASARLAPGIAIRMCDVDCGSQTVGMVKTVLAWRAREAEAAKEVWDALQERNDRLAGVLASGAVEEIPGAVAACRELVRRMGEESGAPIEPASQTELIDAVTGAVGGVYGGVVPGAGGLDALALLMRDDEETKKEVDAFLEKWSAEKGVRVRLLGVKGGMDGVRAESLMEFDGWVR